MQQLDILETKINQTINLIEKLKEENQELLKVNEELRLNVESQNQLINELREENHNLKQMHSDASLNKEKEEQIKHKVEQMLSRLDELQFSM
ncbi:MAG: hypothetical protein ACE5HS_15660 [bacterium]